MRSSTRAIAIILLSLAAVACGGSQGPAGPQGPAGEAGAQGPPGQNGINGTSPDGGALSLLGTISGVVTAKATGQPLANVAVLGVAGTLPAGDAGDPGGALSATTASDGTFSFTKVPVGAYTLGFTRTGYTAMSLPGVGVTVSGGTNLAVALATDTTSSDGMAVTVQNNLNAGYGASVTLTANATAPDANGATLTYAWKQTGGTPAKGLSGANTNAITFTTLNLSDVKLEGQTNVVLAGADGGFVPGRFGPMGISQDETGAYGFQVTVTDPAGHSVTASASVGATATSTGLQNVPIGIPVFLQGDNLNDAGAWAQSTWNWTLDTSGATGSKAEIQNGTSQFPSFTPDVIGDYKVTESVSGKTMTIYAGTYDGVSGGTTQGSGNDYQAQGCTACHNGPTTIPYAGTPNPPPNMFTPWSASNHGTTFARYIDGQIGQEFGPSCYQCHTLGSNAAKSVANGGFDDQASKDGWTQPSPLASGDYANLVSSKPDLAQLANVQCENCHGPQKTDAHPLQTGARISFSEEVCGSCHESAPFNTKAGDWKQSAHAKLTIAISEGLASGGHCSRCHTGQGFSQYAQQLQETGWPNNLYPATSAGYLTSDGKVAAFTGTTQTNAATPASLAALGLTPQTVEPQTCQACHDPHDALGLPSQLRIYDSLPNGLPNGMGPITGAGAGAICMACHNTRNGETDDTTASTLSSTAAIGRAGHDGPQTDMLYGVNAYFVPVSNPSPHLAVKDTCAGCHYAVPNAALTAAGEKTSHSFVADLSICTACHATGSTLVDGAGLQGGVKSQMAALDRLIFAKIADALAAAVTANTSYTASAQDTATGNYLCAAAGTGTPTFKFTAAPAAATITEPQPVAKWRSLNTIWFPMSTLSGTTECTSAGALATTTYNGTAPLSVGLASVKTGATPAFVFVANGILTKAISNEAMIHNDESWGIHNLPFTQTVIDNTTTQLNTLP